MTEYAMDLNGTDETEAAFNTASAFDPSETLPRVDVARGVFITSAGNEIELSDKKVNALILQSIQSSGKPKIPMIEVLLLGKQKQLEPFPGHEGYQARLKEWEEESNMNVLRYLFNVGVKGNPPADFVDEQRAYLPNATPQELKYMWVSSMLPDDDIGAITEAIMGQTSVTAKGIEQSADSFRRNGQR